jgi:sulfite reductase (ferredoxin)
MVIKTYLLPESLDAEINELEEKIVRFKAGELTATEMKVARVPFGVYEQRKKDTYMVRVRCAGAVVTPTQLEKIAELSQRHAAGYIHLTTRQEIQLHYVLIDSLIPVIRELKTVGLSSRGGGGNTVRNIMAQEDAGIADDEIFDVSPYAIALTSRFLAEPDSWNLPRKFKIAFSGSSDDRGYATIDDVGFIAKMKDGKKGFKVYFAGGLGAKTQVGLPLFDFVPEREVYHVAKAVKRVFYNNGNRKNKHAARLRFLVKTLGEEKLKQITLDEYEAVKKEGYPPLEIHAIENGGLKLSSPVEEAADLQNFELWQRRFVRRQKQDGFFSVILPAHLGHVDNDKAIALARFLRPFGDNTIRIRKDQNFLLRNIPQGYLPNLYNFLEKTFDHFNRPFVMDKVIACAGASTCQLGICLSPGAATATMRYLEAADFGLDKAADAVINISGCPNSCGQHHVGDIGFAGKVARKGDKVYPAFTVVAGALVREGETELAQGVGEVAARDLPFVVQDALRKYVDDKNGFSSFREYVRSEQGKEDLKAICARYKETPAFEEDKNYYFDWGTDQIFSIAERGKGECSAGIFDLIESDFGVIQQAKKMIDGIKEKGGTDEQKARLLKDIVYKSAHVLLVTRAFEPKSEQETYDLFRAHFINTGLIDVSFNDLLKTAESKRYEAFLGKEQLVDVLVERVKLLYDVMDSAFNFKLPEGDALHTRHVEINEVGSRGSKTAAGKSADQRIVDAAAVKPDAVKDLRGVACPMNFVKTKMELSKMKAHQVLEIWLDDGAPIDNVPGSVRAEGHKVLSREKTDGYWTVRVEKV